MPRLLDCVILLSEKRAGSVKELRITLLQLIQLKIKLFICGWMWIYMEIDVKCLQYQDHPLRITKKSFSASII